MKRIIFTILTVLIAINLYAQRNVPGDYEIGFSVSGGLSALHFTTVNDNQSSPSFGYGFGWDVAVLFTEQWSLRTGLNMASYQASVIFDRQETRSHVTPKPQGLSDFSDPFYIIAKYSGYEERHEALYLRFPLMVQYRMAKYFYAAAGIQAGILTNGSYRIKSDGLVTEGYSEYTMQPYEGMHGFDNHLDVKSAKKPDFGFALSGAFETGVRWGFNNGMALYTGVFLDYCLNDVRKGNPKKESIVYNEEGKHTFNSILYSQNEEKPMTGKVQPLAVGLRLRLSMGFGK